jgi:hypothetical protein
MTDKEFRAAVIHQTKVLEQIRDILTDNDMDLGPENGSEIWLIDNGRDLGHTGYSL